MTSLSCLLVLLCVSFPVFAESVKPSDVPAQRLLIDSDSDGVIDENDACYKTKKGDRVDARGCPIITLDTKEMTLNINFEYDSAFVQPQYYGEIEKVALFMREYPDTRVIIEGHTDGDGASRYNKVLSNRRAQAVAQVLVSRFSIKALRVTAVGFGEERPLVANDTPDNKLKNRRVVAVIRKLEEKKG